MQKRVFFQNRRGETIVPVAGSTENGAAVCRGEGAIRLTDLIEGDVILLRGRRFQSACVAAVCGGVSHIGIMVNFGGQLFFVESVSYRSALTEPLAMGPGAKKGGVCGVTLPSVLPFYSSSAVFRVTPPFTKDELTTIRAEVLRVYGCRYEGRLLRMANSIFSIRKAPPPATRFHCGQLVAHLLKLTNRFNETGALGPKKCFSGDLTPLDVVSSINCRCLGRLDGTAPLRCSSAGAR